MLDHVFTDAIGALRDTFEKAFLERQAFEERFQVDVLLGDTTWETSYGLPGEGLPPRVQADITPRLAHLGPERLPVLVHRRAVRRSAPHRDRDRHADPAPGAMPRREAACSRSLPRDSPPIGAERLERSPPTVETIHDEGLSRPSTARSRCRYEGSYELDEETLADGSILDDHFSAMGGWIASTLVRLGDLKFEFRPAENDDDL